MPAAQTISLQGQFSQVLIANAAGTLTDVSAYVQGAINIKLDSDDVDVTAFAAAGAPIAGKHLQGALVSSVTISFLYDLVIAKILRQIVGSRVGFQVQIKSGANAAPTIGDEVYTGTMTCLDPTVSYAPGQVATIKCTLDPVDAGAIVPVIATV